MANPHNTIRTWALVAVAVTSVALIAFGWWLITLLAEPTWCNRAVGAVERAEGRPESAVAGCFALLDRQVSALALNSHFALGTIALSLLVLVVIVLAGGRLSFKASTTGVSGDISSEGEAAKQVADAAVEEAEAIAGAVDAPEGEAR